MSTVARNQLVIAVAMFAVGICVADDELKVRAEAEAAGRALVQAEGSASGDSEVVRAARTRISGWCDYEYKTVVVADPAGQPTVYFLAQPKPPELLVLGRHFRVTGEAVEASTKSCIALPKAEPGKSPAAAYTTHLLSETPTAFHVYLSLKYQTPLYVGAGRGKWKVERGKIEWLGT